MLKFSLFFFFSLRCNVANLLFWQHYVINHRGNLLFWVWFLSVCGRFTHLKCNFCSSKENKYLYVNDVCFRYNWNNISCVLVEVLHELIRHTYILEWPLLCVIFFIYKTIFTFYVANLLSYEHFLKKTHCCI